jgi:hypothetical protein
MVHSTLDSAGAIERCVQKESLRSEMPIELGDGMKMIDRRFDRTRNATSLESVDKGVGATIKSDRVVRVYSLTITPRVGDTVRESSQPSRIIVGFDSQFP